MASLGMLGKSRQFSGSMIQHAAPHDHEDSEIAFDVREDEEQQVKYNETVELLLATGYFRARIKGLTPFDKVVGGMTWCITTCNFDVDVDLLFQENSTIGQKIALTEKIVAVLPKMKCPHRIEPHQIQGLDFIHIFPVIQWLVKKAIATREEMGDYIRAFSISQFDKHHQTPEDDRFEEMKEKASSSVSALKKVHRPQRKYRRFDADKLTDEETRVQSTLLEYGRHLGISRVGKSSEGSELSDKKKAVDTVLGSSGEEIDEEKQRKEEEKRIKSLMRGMSAMQGHEGKLTASAVGSIVELQSEQIQQIASEYADKQSELVQIERAERVGGAQQHKRVTATLRKQLEQQGKKLEVLEKTHVGLRDAHLTTQDKLKEVIEHGTRIDEEIDKLSEMETEANQSVLERLRSLVTMNESLKRQEQEFRSHCKDEMTRLQGDIDRIKEESGDTADETPETKKAIERQLEADKEKLHKIRLLMARKNREISVLQRKIDEVPSRAELGQYQRRFVELYNQMAAKHKETKQFYTLYNTLDDSKLYLNKEVNLLNSIHDNFEQAMSSQATKEQFLKQFEQIVEGIKQNRIKVEKKKQGEKMKRDQLNDHYIDLVEKQRLYFKTVKDFKEECRKNEILLDKLRAR